MENKHERVLKNMYKFKKRLKKFNISEEELKKDPKSYNCYRTTSTPCSCTLCSPRKYDNKLKTKYKIKYKHKLYEK